MRCYQGLYLTILELLDIWKPIALFVTDHDSRDKSSPFLELIWEFSSGWRILPSSSWAQPCFDSPLLTVAELDVNKPSFKPTLASHPHPAFPAVALLCFVELSEGVWCPSAPWTLSTRRSDCRKFVSAAETSACLVRLWTSFTPWDMTSVLCGRMLCLQLPSSIIQPFKSLHHAQHNARTYLILPQR